MGEPGTDRRDSPKRISERDVVTDAPGCGNNHPVDRSTWPSRHLECWHMVAILNDDLWLPFWMDDQANNAYGRHLEMNPENMNVQ